MSHMQRESAQLSIAIGPMVIASKPPPATPSPTPILHPRGRSEDRDTLRCRTGRGRVHRGISAAAVAAIACPRGRRCLRGRRPATREAALAEGGGAGFS